MEEFLDYYELLQISPNAEPQTVERVYRMLAGRYHPDNPATGDTEKFVQLQHAFETLSDPALRASYDELYNFHRAQPMPIFQTEDFLVGVQAEANRRVGLLCLLYLQRRNSPERPFLSLLELERMMALPREHLEFTCWFLAEEEHIRRGDSGGLTITSKGVKFVESSVPANRIVSKLLKAAGADDNGGRPGPDPSPSDS